ncbi:cysteine desulfurase family protein [Solibacillus sp. FSL W7-1472]|uniref:cysteine desulfurase n=1 Tax=Solibacillus silvestris (strain StLB046) TaxID=1002809 RepID=F2F7T6_SOLSS|nr:cysteine desulfurase family protein [Solibacillus silvestris]OBW60006.1 cysteine desulfurase NifS [Solibacillus silvestris]BAK16029.1 cysteine sulfinate desulfinase/cysteine desulfurase [Solibacillus silvestris StLB046]
MKNSIYLDHAATSPIASEVIDVMARAMAEESGNASSIHTVGRSARKALDESRASLAAKLNAKPSEIIFTSGGTEADNMAIFGTAYARQKEGKHIITTAIEHHAVLHACEKLEKEGFTVTYLPVDQTGRIRAEQVKEALRDDTILVTIMYGNNEVGTIQPIAEIGAIVKEHTATFHTDAVQAFGLEKMDVEALHVDLLSVSAHKINGPKGIGFLYAKTGVKLTNILYGGSQEKKRRAGTENVPAVIAFAKAAELAGQSSQQRMEQYNGFKNILIEQFQQANIDFHLNGHQTSVLPHVLNVTFPGTDVESFLINLDMAGVLVSSGSACTAGSIDPSHVLVAMYGQNAPELRSSIRFSFGLGLTDELVREAGKRTAEIVKRLTP